MFARLWIGTDKGPNILNLATGKMWLGVQDMGVDGTAGGEPGKFSTSPDLLRSLTMIRVWVRENPFTSHPRSRGSLRLDPGALLSVFDDHAGIPWRGLRGGGNTTLD